MNAHTTFAAIAIFNALSALLTGAYVYFKNRQHEVNQSFFVFSITVGLWCFFYAFWQIQATEASALFFLRTMMIPTYYIPFTFLWFVLAVTDRSVLKRFLPYFFFMPVIMTLFSYSPHLVKGVAQRLYFAFWPVPGQLMHYFILLFFIILVIAFYFLIKDWKNAKGFRRWQLSWITFPLLMAFIGGSTNWFLWYDIPVPPIATGLVGIIFLLLAYAIIRRHLFDVYDFADYIREAKLSSIGLLAASMNHEIRNPLYVIKGLAEAHLANMDEHIYSDQKQADQKLRELLHKTIQHSERAMDIMKRFSTFAKRAVDDSVKEKKAFLVESLDNILPLIRHEMELDKIEFDCRIPRDVPPISVDPGHLEEILFNLIVNACHALKGGGKIAIQAAKMADNLHIEISDNGPGIPKDKIGKIFEPFFTTKGEGTGLGLYVCKQLIERNGGKIIVKSEYGTGSAFQMVFAQVS